MVLFDSNKIAEANAVVGKKISNLISNHNMHKPTMLCVLDGAFRFYSDLMNHIEHPVICDFIKVSSYERTEQGNFTIHKYPKYPLEGKDIIIVDDIYDSGNTINYTVKQLMNYKPKSISVVTLLHRQATPIPIENILEYITGYFIGDEWVAGYGMDDFDGTSRNLNYIYKLDKK